MKHEVTSLNTKKMIAESLKKIMKTKPFSKITVSEIIRDCGVNRKTFYYHFENTYALLKWIFEEEAIEMVKNYDLLTDYEQAISFIMDYVEKNELIISCAYDSIGREEMKRVFSADFTALVATIIDRMEERSETFLSDSFKQFLCRFFTSALVGTLIEWIQNKNSRNREQTIQYLTFIIKCSLSHIIQEGPPPERASS